jgi:hypothetical protein
MLLFGAMFLTGGAVLGKPAVAGASAAAAVVGLAGLWRLRGGEAGTVGTG